MEISTHNLIKEGGRTKERQDLGWCLFLQVSVVFSASWSVTFSPTRFMAALLPEVFASSQIREDLRRSCSASVESQVSEVSSVCQPGVP